MNNTTLPHLRANIIALGVVQAGNYLVPLLVLPYLARVLGTKTYGELVFVQTVMQFGMLVVDFGFGWSATRDIATARNDKAKVSALFADTWGLQWLLFAVVSLVIGSAVFYLPALQAHWAMYLLGLGMVLGQVLFPVWLMQGLEALKAAAVAQVAGKFLALPCLLLWVHGPQDQLGGIAFFSLSSLFSGLIALWWINRYRWIKWQLPTAHGVRLAFIQGIWLFCSRLSISIYTIAVPLAVGLLAGSAQLALFSLADKVRAAVQSLLTPVAQALFPRMSYLFKTDQNAAHILLYKSAWVLGVLSLTAGLVVYWLADEIVLLIGGREFVQSAEVLRWVALIPFAVAGSNLLGVQIMLPKGMNHSFVVILTGASTISLLGLYPMIALNGAIGAAQLVLCVEYLVTASMLIYLWRAHIFLAK